MNEGVAAHVLLEFGADPDRIRNEIIPMLSGQVRQELSPGSDPEFDPDHSWAGRHYSNGGGFRPVASPLRAFVFGWALFGAALGIGVLVGWLIWG